MLVCELRNWTLCIRKAFIQASKIIQLFLLSPHLFPVRGSSHNCRPILCQREEEEEEEEEGTACSPCCVCLCLSLVFWRLNVNLVLAFQRQCLKITFTDAKYLKIHRMLSTHYALKNIGTPPPGFLTVHTDRQISKATKIFNSHLNQTITQTTI